MNNQLKYQLDDVVTWIKENELTSIAIQLDDSLLEDSTNLLLALQSILPGIQFNLIVSDSCSIDYLAVQHLGAGKVDGLIKFGETCLAPIPRKIDELPVLIVFGIDVNQDSLDFTFDTINRIKQEEDNNIDETTNCQDCQDNWLILYSNSYVELAKQLSKQFSWCKIVKLQSFSFNWDFTPTHRDMVQCDINAECSEFGPFCLTDELSNYRKIIYLGSRLNLSLRLMGNVVHIDPVNRKCDIRKGQRELTKRIGLIEKLKAKRSLSLGFLFTNSFPSTDDYIEKIDMIKKKSHTISKIMFIHSTDESKLGNFADLDSFILINGCKCTKLIDELDLHLPVLTFKEYEIVCGIKLNYGGVDWNQEEVDDADEDEEQLSSGPNNQLVQSEILSKDSWYGLTVNPAFQPISFVKEGQKGIASGYSNEPTNH